MIEIYARRRGERCTFFATGHAAEGDERDVVCAGASALIGALVLYAVQASVRYLRYTMASGQVFLSCHGLGTAFDLVLTGLSSVAVEYPEHLRVTIDDKGAGSSEVRQSRALRKVRRYEK